MTLDKKTKKKPKVSDFIYNCGIKVLFLGNFMTIENMMVTCAKLSPRANKSHNKIVIGDINQEIPRTINDTKFWLILAVRYVKGPQDIR